MKKTIYAACLLVAASFSSCGIPSASNLLSSSSNPLASVTSSGSGSNILSGVSSALSGEGLLGNVLSSFLGNSSLTTADLTGTWTYTGADCVFESDNLLKKAGGALAANEVEKQIDTNLSKIGIKEGSSTFTFDGNGNFTALLGGKKITGTYVLNEKNKKLTLSTMLGLGKMTAQVAKSGNSISLLFDSSKLLKLAQVIGSISGSSSVKTLGDLAASYDGMKIGLRLKK